jgi:hypothetical protein
MMHVARHYRIYAQGNNAPLFICSPSMLARERIIVEKKLDVQIPLSRMHKSIMIAPVWTSVIAS